LIKGYGETHQRGKGNFLRILDTLVEGGAVPDARARIEAIRKAREAALADPEGRKLEQSLEAHGIAPLPPRPKPIVFSRRKPGEHRNAA
jgi:indolepyruvate ferredoxin oxidoreductase beta subunit